MWTQIRQRSVPSACTEIASSKSFAVAGSIVKVVSSRRSRRPSTSIGARIACRALDGRVEAALEAAVEHQRLEHVGGDVGAAEPAHDLRVALAAAVG